MKNNRNRKDTQFILSENKNWYAKMINATKSKSHQERP